MLKTKHPSFSSVAERLSVRKVTEVELLELKKYQLSLIDFLLYGMDRKIKNKHSGALLKEIADVEAHLKNKWSEIFHKDNTVLYANA
jgi:hypothetical protein